MRLEDHRYPVVDRPGKVVWLGGKDGAGEHLPGRHDRIDRAAERRKETTVRLAIGASRGRMAQYLLVESVLLGIVGGALGLALAAAGLRLVAASLPPDSTRITPGTASACFCATSPRRSTYVFG